MICSFPPTLSMAVFLPWDLTFGSGMQTLGLLVSVLAAGWCMTRARALRELSSGDEDRSHRALYFWLRYAVPVLVLAVGLWWLMTDVLGWIAAV